MVQRVQRIEEDDHRGNRQIQLAKAATNMIEAYNKSSIELATNIEEETQKAKEANKNSETAKLKEAYPSAVAAFMLIALTAVISKDGNSQLLPASTQLTSIGHELGKKKFEAKGIASSGLEQYTRLAMEKLKEMVSMISRVSSEITSQVTNINRQSTAAG